MQIVDLKGEIGASEGIRTPDPQIRSLRLGIDKIEYFRKLASKTFKSYQWVSPRIANCRNSAKSVAKTEETYRNKYSCRVRGGEGSNLLQNRATVQPCAGPQMTDPHSNAAAPGRRDAVGLMLDDFASAKALPRASGAVGTGCARYKKTARHPLTAVAGHTKCRGRI